LLSLIPVAARAKTELAAAMEGAGRYYHNGAHLAQLWRRHRRHADAEGLGAPEIEKAIACAIAYHDIVCETGRRDNEDRSADVWLAVSAKAVLSDRDKQWVAATIRATKDHLGYRPTVDVEHAPAGNLEALKERARVWVLDLDLSPLAEPPAAFDRNTERLRREGASIAESDWRAGQAMFLGKLLKAPRIFRTPTLFALYEAQARSNIARLLARLGG
jgi:predicted metal-dependent HD superfamily phosphohydrolase